MTSYVGIDLGTTFSVVSTIDETGRPIIVNNKDGKNLTPSCVYFRKDNVAEVGEEARRLIGIDKNAIGRFKRDMGTSVKFSARGDEYTPTQLSTLVLKKLVKDTLSSLGDIREAVVTIPANFSHEARQATMEAASAAGLKVNYIINEPTAAALYYAFKNGSELNGVYAVYDLGGGTFDVSIIRADGQDIHVLSSNGLAKLGGDDFDAALQKIVAKKFKNTTGQSLDLDDFTKNDAEDEKKSLSKREQVTVRVARQLIEVTRSEFESEISAQITQAEMLCEAAVEEAGVAIEDIRGVFLAGGSTRMPIVRSSVEKVFKKEIISTVNVDEVVALGASLYAAYKSDRKGLSETQKKSINKIKVRETTGKCFGTISVTTNESRDKLEMRNSVIIRKGEKIPCSKTESFYTVFDDQTAVQCQVTESTSPETDPRFVKVIWNGKLELPPRPKGKEVQVTYAYDDNQIMKCSFLDVESGKQTKVDLTVNQKGESDSSNIDKFMVE